MPASADALPATSSLQRATPLPEPPRETVGDGAPASSRRVRGGGFLPVMIAALVAALVGFFGVRFWLAAGASEGTDDAFLDNHTVNVAPQVAGRVAAVHVDDNQRVKAGDLLVEIDPRDFAAVVAQRKALMQIDDAKRRQEETGHEQAVAQVESARQAKAQADAEVRAQESASELAEADQRRAQELRRTSVISAQEADRARNAADSARANLQAARNRTAGAEAGVTQAEAGLEATEARITAAESQIRQDQAQLETATLQLSYATIAAPVEGRVTSKSVEVGAFVSVGQNLLALVPPTVWVTANFKETQLARMRPGQRARVRVDAYPGMVLNGHVDSIQSGSGAQFSLLPPENATGNYVKVVQRVPVKIVLERDPNADPSRTLGPGMSVTPEVFISDRPPSPVWPPVAALLLGLTVGVGVWFWRNRRGSQV